MMFSKTSVYIESYGAQAKLIYFLIEDYLSEKYNTIWDNVSANIKNQFDSKPTHNKDFLKTKIKSHDNVVTDFYDKKIPKVIILVLQYLAWIMLSRKMNIIIPKCFSKSLNILRKK